MRAALGGRSLLLGLGFILAMSAMAAAQAPSQTAPASPTPPPVKRTKNGAPEFPSSPAAWVNSAPISVEAMTGKAAFMWFYEEGCPKCKEKWPELIALSKKYADKPIVFIAVNSGTPRNGVESYARENGVTWPIVVDLDRSYEAAADVGGGKISLQNVMQLKILAPEGRLANGNWADLDVSVQLALKGAGWKVEPEGMPAALAPAWKAVEFGNYAVAAGPIKKAAASGKADMKSFGERLKSAVQQEIDKQVGLAKSAAEAGNKFDAYRGYLAVAEKFPGYELPPEVATAKTELAADQAVKDELSALKSLEAAKKMAKPRAVAALKRLATDKANTEAGKQATELLEQLGVKL